MNILVVNDDGIGAVGIHKLAEALSETGDVYICSPHVEQSGSGHGITMGRMVYVEDVPFAEAKAAISMEGTPADCVKIGLEVYRDRGVLMDMVFSGFNHGMNLGTDTFYSGTVSAAVEGALCGLPSAAMSISSNMSPDRSCGHFETAMKLARHIARSEMFSKKAGKAPKELSVDFIHEDHTILNVNIPDKSPEDIKGVKVCPLSYRAYDEWFRKGRDERGRTGYYISGVPQIIGDADAEESDIIANRLGYVTITPLHFDLTNKRILGALRDDWSGFAV